MLKVPREKLQFKTLERLMSMSNASDMLRTLLVGYYDATDKEIDEMDADKALGLCAKVYAKFNKEKDGLTIALKKVSEPSPASPTAE